MNADSQREIRKLRQEVEANPNDLACHFELGAALLKQRQISEAIRHLQVAQTCTTPLKLRWAAMHLLADAFEARGWADMAKAKREQAQMESGEDDSSGPAQAPKPAPVIPTPPRHLKAAKDLPPSDKTHSYPKD